MDHVSNDDLRRVEAQVTRKYGEPRLGTLIQVMPNQSAEMQILALLGQSDSDATTMRLGNESRLMRGRVREIVNGQFLCDIESGMSVRIRERLLGYSPEGLNKATAVAMIIEHEVTSALDETVLATFVIKWQYDLDRSTTH
jgi:hypothetical protein